MGVIYSRIGGKASEHWYLFGYDFTKESSPDFAAKIKRIEAS